MLNNLQPLEIKQLNITCTTMENPLSACYSDILWNVLFLCAFFFLAPSNNFDEVEQREKKRNLRVDHRKIHLKNSFRFYWFHINVSIDRRSNKGLLSWSGKMLTYPGGHKLCNANGIWFTYAAHFMYLSSGVHTYSTHTHNRSLSFSPETYRTTTPNRATRVWVCAPIAFRKIHFGCKNRGIFEF